MSKITSKFVSYMDDRMLKKLVVWAQGKKWNIGGHLEWTWRGLSGMTNIEVISEATEQVRMPPNYKNRNRAGDICGVNTCTCRVYLGVVLDSVLRTWMTEGTTELAFDKNKGQNFKPKLKVNVKFLSRKTQMYAYSSSQKIFTSMNLSRILQQEILIIRQNKT